MSPVIRVENLSKRYTLGARAGGAASYDTFREALVRNLKRPFARRPPSAPAALSSVLRPLTSDAPSSDLSLSPSAVLRPPTSDSPSSDLFLPSSPSSSVLSSGLRPPPSEPPPPSSVVSPSPSDFWALRDVSFEIQPGEVVGIIGRNGAGKSTLLKILSRITEPTSGRVSVQGRLASLLEVGTGFHPELTGRENIFLNGVILGMTRAEVKKRFDEIVAFAETEQFLDTPVKHYSSGMYVRLAFAVAAHLDPEILVVDEVLAVGDAAFQKKCLGKMNEACRQEGRTVLLVSHNSGALMSICQNGLWLDKGQLAYAGTISDCLARYNASGTNSSVRFETDRARPSIESVEVDEAALRKGNLRIRVAFQSPFPLKPPVVGVILYNKFGQPIFGSNTRMTDESWSPSAMSSGVFVCSRENAPLCNDSYKISVWLGDADNDYDSKLDALFFEFITPRYHPKSPSVEVTGSVYLPWQWEVAST